MKRRALLKAIAAASAAGFTSAQRALAAIPKMKITRIRAYLAPQPNTLFNQSNIVIGIETDAGITGVGEGGSHDTIEQCAGRLIGQDPCRQCIATLLPSSSASAIFLSNESVACIDVGTPRSGIGNGTN